MAPAISGNFATRTEAREGRTLTAQEIYDSTAAHERALTRLLILYVGTGLFFMLLPGTFLGVWNLIHISSRGAAASVSASWIQGHGQAQLFGWIGTFILGIGFYSIPKLRRMERFALWTARATWAMWTSGVTLRWLANVYEWQWRVLLPVSGLLQLAAFAIFFKSVAGHKPAPDESGAKRTKLELWALVVISATLGLAGAVLANFAGTVWQAWAGTAPAFAPRFDSMFLVLTAWGAIVPFVWGFSAKWLPIFLGLRETRNGVLAGAVVVNAVAVITAMSGALRIAAVLLLAGCVAVPIALRMFEGTRQPAKVNGVHKTFPIFVRAAYMWAIAGAALGVWAAFAGEPNGVVGAGRHALTVGFIATMVFCIGQRVLPAFCGMRVLWSRKLMFAALAMLTAGCALRVMSEVLAYQNYYAAAWKWLPVSAVIELSAVTVFAINMLASLASEPPSARYQLHTISSAARD